MSGKSANGPPELELRAKNLTVWMVLSRDLITKDSFLLLSAENRLDERMIKQILDFEEAGGDILTIHVYAERKHDASRPDR